MFQSAYTGIHVRTVTCTCVRTCRYVHYIYVSVCWYVMYVHTSASHTTYNAYSVHYFALLCLVIPLSLSRNSVSDEGAVSVSEALKHYSQLQYLK